MCINIINILLKISFFFLTTQQQSKKKKKKENTIQNLTYIKKNRERARMHTITINRINKIKKKKTIWKLFLNTYIWKAFYSIIISH
jgi:hypothetical protein